MQAKSFGASSHAPNRTTIEWGYACSGNLPNAINNNTSTAVVAKE